MTTIPKLHSETTTAEAKMIVRERYELPAGEFTGTYHGSGSPDLALESVTVTLVSTGAPDGWSNWRVSARVEGRRILKSGELGAEHEARTWMGWGKDADDPRVALAVELTEHCKALALVKYSTPVQVFERMGEV